MYRDQHGIILQEGNGEDYVDGGDAAFSTGMMAFAGSTQDAALMTMFLTNGKVIRYPFHPEYSKPEETSRDQILAFFAGLNHPYFNDHPEEKKAIQESCLFYAQSWRVNNDVLSFNHKFYFYKLSGHRAPLWIYPIAYFNQALNVLWDAFIKPGHEMNQSSVMNCIYGIRWIKALNALHPGLVQNIMHYYTDGRNKQEMGIRISTRILAATTGDKFWYTIF